MRAKEKARGKKCHVRFSLVKKNKAFQKMYVKVGSRKVSGDGSHAKIKIEEADDSSSGQKEYDLVVPFHGGFWS